MGWNVSHGTDQYGQMRRSYTSMSNLGEQIARILPRKEWGEIRHLFNRSSGDPFTIPPAEAGRIAQILRTAAQHRRMPADWASDTNLLADTEGQRFNATIAGGPLTVGPEMTSGLKLPVGEKALGWIVFEVPKDSKLASVQFTMNSGFADQTGQWTLKP